jgi:HK97 family phage prohead protease
MIHTRFSEALQADESGRTVFGIVVPFDQTATVDDGSGPYRETFLLGAFARTIAQRGHKVRLHLMHDTARSLPIGKAVELEERPEGLFGAFKVARTQSGDDALTAIREGLAEAFSIGFTSVRQETVGGVVQRREVSLREVSVVHSPAYAGAAIAGIRSQTLLSAVDYRRRLQLLTEGTPFHE